MTVYSVVHKVNFFEFRKAKFERCSRVFYKLTFVKKHFVRVSALRDIVYMHIYANQIPRARCGTKQATIVMVTRF